MFNCKLNKIFYAKISISIYFILNNVFLTFKILKVSFNKSLSKFGYF